MKSVKLSTLRQGDYFHLKDSDDSPIWVRNHYDRSSKTYSISKYDDFNHEIFRRGSLIVYVYE